MKKNILLIFCLCCFIYQKNLAATGDTIVVQAHQNYVINWYGNYDTWAVFPPAGTSYSKVLMQYKLSQPQPGTQWDYTTNVFARVRTGELDSTLATYPYYTVNANVFDTIYFNTSQVYIYYYNSASQSTDSAIASTLQLHLFMDPSMPTVATDSMTIYPGNFYNYIYDMSGAVTDSVYVTADSTWINQYHNIYTTFEVIEPFELGRVMTPYGSTLGSAWSHSFWFDVTDYTPLFHDSVEMRVRYDGYSNGYAFSVVFYLIEGTPARNVERVRNIYPFNYYEYGIAGNPIENHLVPVKVDLNAAETNAMLRVIPSGHSFGGAQNCAEFCNKSFKLLIDGVQQFSKSIWRNDCGMNPIWHQGGTWLYDRSNWCPGDKTLNKDQELTPFITAGDSVTLDLNLDTYTYSGGAGFNPGYILSTQLFTYGNPNFVTDATVNEIIRPNADENYARFNPICNNPSIVIKNNGSATLTSLTIKYGIKNGTAQYYNWTGSLGFLQTEVVNLDSMTWGGSGTGDDNIFEVVVSNPNNVADQYNYNDTLRSKINFTPVYPSQFRLLWLTNNAANETTYQLLNDQGVILYSNASPLMANTLYSDTFNLATGCYQLRINDSGKDGLAFFANSDGTGYARLVKSDGTSTIIKTFQADFGTAIIHNFTVGVATGTADVELKEGTFNIYPNPSSGNITIETYFTDHGKLTIDIYNVQGRQAKQVIRQAGAVSRFDVDLSDLPAGMYFVRINSTSGSVVKKLLRN